MADAPPAPLPADADASRQASKGGRTTLWLYLLAAALRLAPVVLTAGLGIGLDDMFQYDMLGRSLAAGHGFRWYAPNDLRQILAAMQAYAGIDVASIDLPTDPRGMLTSFRAPLYPAFLGLVYAAFGLTDRFLAARALQALIGASLAPLAYAIARELNANQRLAVGAGVVTAAWPMLVALPLGLATETLFLPALAAGTWLLLRAERSGADRHHLLAGLLLALATMTRSVIIGFPLLAALRWWRQGRRRPAILFLLPLVALATPWIVRNSLLHQRPTMIESSMGYNLYLGYHPEGTGSFQFGPSLDLLTILDDAERDAVGRQYALAFIQQDPARVPLLVAHKWGHFWGLEDRIFSFLYSNGFFGRWPTGAVVAALIILSLPLLLVLPLAIFGWTMSPRDPPWTILSMLFAWYIGVHLLIMAEERFHFALVPMLTALAARGLTRWPTDVSRLRTGDPAALRRLWLGGAILLTVVLAWVFELATGLARYAVLANAQGWQASLPY
jgi:4-amino-4-deoxy-L-arabinose transferase-like glycosyltransferase